MKLNRLSMYFLHNLELQNNNSRKIDLNKSIFIGCGFGVLQCINYLIRALMFWYGGQLVVQGAYSLNQMLTVFVLIMFSTSTASQIFAHVPQFGKSFSAASQVFYLLPIQTAPDDQRRNLTFPVDASRIVFDNVSFAYSMKPPVPIFSNLRLQLTEYQITAIVGKSGSGKSTLASLITRLYEPQSGSIRIGDTPLADIDVGSLRSHIAFVTQNHQLIAGSIISNLVYGLRFLPSQKEIVRVMRIVDMDQFVLSLPEGYDTVLSGTSSLSGGQSQRLALARALLRHPTILVLDECTSALDTLSRAVIMRALSNLFEEEPNVRFVIMITHDEYLKKLAQSVVEI